MRNPRSTAVKAGGSSRLVQVAHPRDHGQLAPRQDGGLVARLVQAQDRVLLALDHQRRDATKPSSGVLSGRPAIAD